MVLVVSVGYFVVVVSLGEAVLVVSTGDDVGSAVFVVSIGDDVGSAVLVVVVGNGVTGIDVTGMVVVGDGEPPAAEVAAMAAVPAPSTPTATAATTMAFRDRSTAGIRMGCPLDFGSDTTSMRPEPHLLQRPRNSQRFVVVVTEVTVVSVVLAGELVLS